MTQTIAFTRSTFAAPQFLVTLDNATYNVVITWNVSSQRYFINVYDFNGNLICTVPLVETPPAIALAGLTWDQDQLAVIATLATPFYRPVGQIVQYTITGCQPDTFNGTFEALTLSQTQFSYPLTTDPGQAVVLGYANRYLNMIEPWFNSTLIFRGMLFQADP